MTFLPSYSDWSQENSQRGTERAALTRWLSFKIAASATLSLATISTIAYLSSSLDWGALMPSTAPPSLLNIKIHTEKESGPRLLRDWPVSVHKIQKNIF